MRGVNCLLLANACPTSSVNEAPLRGIGDSTMIISLSFLFLQKKKNVSLITPSSLRVYVINLVVFFSVTMNDLCRCKNSEKNWIKFTVTRQPNIRFGGS